MISGVIISGTGSGVGKTLISTGIMLRLSNKKRIQPFKAGPDFIDPMYHTIATSRIAGNLDSFLASDAVIRNIVGYESKDADMCIIEGVRGLFEGFRGDGDEGSTAHLAKILGFPVVLVVDSRSITRSSAAIINGFRSFDPDINIAGVILNNISGSQHADKLRVSMERYCPQVKLLGMIKKSQNIVLEQRYLGLKTPNTTRHDISPFCDIADSIDLDMLEGIVESRSIQLPEQCPYTTRQSNLTAAIPVDDSYCFYYKENIECLRSSGFNIKKFGPTNGDKIPDADLYYLGGGYPELYADRLSENKDFLNGLHNASIEGKVIIGECGGLMTMCKNIANKDGKCYEMSGIFSANAMMTGVRHGPKYVVAKSNNMNPIFRGDIRGHEYHYSDVYPNIDQAYGFNMSQGKGVVNNMDGLINRNSIGSYMHQYALSTNDWIGGAVDKILKL